jgi:hypothetical protein
MGVAQASSQHRSRKQAGCLRYESSIDHGSRQDACATKVASILEYAKTVWFTHKRKRKMPVRIANKLFKP